MSEIQVPVNSHPRRIVVIDDDRGILLSLRMFLEENYEVDAFEDARLALQHIKNNAPGLVIVDILMPNMTGTEFITELRKTNTELPVIAMSASTVIDTRLQNLKISNFIRKPFDIDDLEKVVAKFFN